MNPFEKGKFWTRTHRARSICFALISAFDAAGHPPFAARRPSVNSRGVAMAMRPVLRGEEPAAREPGVGGLGVTGIAESSCESDEGSRFGRDSRLYCATKY